MASNLHIVEHYAFSKNKNVATAYVFNTGSSQGSPKCLNS